MTRVEWTLLDFTDTSMTVLKLLILLSARIAALVDGVREGAIAQV